METILWIALIVSIAGPIFTPITRAWRLHRRTSERLHAERKGAGGAPDHRYDPKQYRRGR